MPQEHVRYDEKVQKKLRSKYLDAHATPKDKLNNRPPGVRLEDWEAFIEDNLSPKTIQRKKNIEVRKKINIYHTSGRYGHARLQKKMVNIGMHI